MNNKTAGNKDVQLYLLPSFIHMSVNRLFPTSQRKYELLLYFFLETYYYSLAARNKK